MFFLYSIERHYDDRLVARSYALSDGIRQTSAKSLRTLVKLIDDGPIRNLPDQKVSYSQGLRIVQNPLSNDELRLLVEKTLEIE